MVHNLDTGENSQKPNMPISPMHCYSIFRLHTIGHLKLAAINEIVWIRVTLRTNLFFIVWAGGKREGEQNCNLPRGNPMFVRTLIRIALQTCRTSTQQILDI